MATEDTGVKSIANNPHLKSLEDDHLFHLGLDANADLRGTFGDVKFVCLGGSPKRMKNFAAFIKDELKSHLNKAQQDNPCVNLSKTDRYVLYKVGPVLSASHGIGVPSLTIILHEIMKLLHYADAKDVEFIRIGTSGGLGIDPGTVVITTMPVDPLFQPYCEKNILGQQRRFQAELDANFRENLLKCAGDIPTVEGNTICTNDFYEEQGKLDGAFCDYSSEDKMKYLQKAYDKGVRNIEMECTTFASMCNRANVPAAIVCVTLVDRLKRDQVTLTPEKHAEFELRPQQIVARYLSKKI